MDIDNCNLEYRLPLLGDSLNLAALDAITKQIKGGLISEGIFSPQIREQMLVPDLHVLTLVCQINL